MHAWSQSLSPDLDTEFGDVDALQQSFGSTVDDGGNTEAGAGH